MKKTIWSLFLVTAMFLMDVPVLKAEESPRIGDQEKMDDDVSFTFGVVEDVSDNGIILREYNYETDQEVSTVYAADPNAELENISSLNDIAKGDEIEIYFVEQDGKKVATFISKYEDIQDDDLGNETSNISQESFPEGE